MSEPSQESPRAALERASRALRAGGETPWESPGEKGTLARRGLRRVLRPYTYRQAEIDAAILEAVGALWHRAESGGLGPLALAEVLDAESVEEAETQIGKLWLRRDDHLVTPTIREHGMWGPETCALLEDELAEGDTFIDVGANIGYFSVFASPLVGERGRVIAVEPDPDNLPLLRSNLWRHRRDNATVLPVAAWPERGHISLMDNPDGSSGSWVTSDTEDHMLRPAAAKALVPAAPLDELIGEGRVAVIKIDCEHTDHLVVQSAERLLAENPEAVVVVEFFPEATSHMGERPEEILAYYRGLGFDLQLIRPGKPPQAAGDDEILAAGDLVDLVLRRP